MSRTMGCYALRAGWLFLASLIFLLPLGNSWASNAPWGAPVKPGGKTLWGFITFPYDFTLEAINTTNRVARENGSLYVVHRDNGIPWQEALEDARFPRKVRDEWNDYARRKPAGAKVYLALAPLAEDRKSLIHASEGSRTPSGFYRKALDSSEVKTAYRNYVRRAIEKFRPDYLNIGIEAGQMAARDPARWPQFVRLFEYVAKDVRSRYPSVKLGISFGLQSLMEPDVERRARVIIDQSDYLGLSFYPFLSALPEAFGAAPLPPPPEQWRKPLRWLEKYAGKIPVAFSETAYTTRSGRLDGFNLAWEGRETLQQAYVRDLANFARKDHYLFVVWFAPIDYEALSRKLNGGEEGIHLIWQNVGFLDQHQRPKPALQTWRTAVAGGNVGQPVSPVPVAQGTMEETSGIGVRLDLSAPKRYFAALPGNRVSHDNSGPEGNDAMRWSFVYRSGQFQWLAWSFEQGTLSGTQRLKLMIRSDREGPLLIQLEESDGEAYFHPVVVKSGWQTIDVPYERLQPDAAKRRNGTLEPERLVKLLIADPGAATEGASGERSIWFANWTFE